MAREVVLSRMAMNTVYSQNGEVAKDQRRYWRGFLGMYRLTGLADRANSIQLRCRMKSEFQIVKNMINNLTWFLSKAQSWNADSPSLWNVTITKPTKMLIMKKAIIIR